MKQSTNESNSKAPQAAAVATVVMRLCSNNVSLDLLKISAPFLVLTFTMIQSGSFELYVEHFQP